MSTEPSKARIFVVMGVAGCGKTSVGALLAERLRKPFLDADDFHPPENVARMSRGIALTDADRWPWLDSLGAALRRQADEHGGVVAACSALRRAYRERLLAAAGETILFVYLQGSRDVIGARMAARSDHFMPAALLDSQFATLEPPGDDEHALAIDVRASIAELAEGIHRELERQRIVEA